MDFSGTCRIEFQVPTCTEHIAAQDICFRKLDPFWDVSFLTQSEHMCLLYARGPSSASAGAYDRKQDRRSLQHDNRPPETPTKNDQPSRRHKTQCRSHCAVLGTKTGFRVTYCISRRSCARKHGEDRMLPKVGTTGPLSGHCKHDSAQHS